MEIEQLLQEEGATSFSFADSEGDAVACALTRRPDVITSDVQLASGTGPGAVSSIHQELGPIPVIFITGTPEACSPCDPPGVILAKPISTQSVKEAFRNCRM